MESTLFDDGWNASVWNSDLDQNYSSGNGSLFEDQEEFPYWQLAMAVRVLLAVFIVLPINVFLNVSVLFTFFTDKSLLKPMNMIHVVLAGQLFLVKTATVLAVLFADPSAVRYCVCINDVNVVLAPIIFFNIVCVNVLLTCLSVVQFLIIKGKMKLIGWKLATVLVAVSIFYSMPLFRHTLFLVLALL